MSIDDPALGTGSRGLDENVLDLIISGVLEETAQTKRMVSLVIPDERHILVGDSSRPGKKAEEGNSQ